MLAEIESGAKYFIFAETNIRHVSNTSHEHRLELQLGLNFADQLPELFTGKEMGEDALRVLNEYLKLHARIRSDVEAELPLVRAAIRSTKRLLG